METEKEKLQELLDAEYSKGLKTGMWIGGISIAIFIFVLIYLLPPMP
jgi:hypothetical protein